MLTIICSMIHNVLIMLKSRSLLKVTIVHSNASQERQSPKMKVNTTKSYLLEFGILRMPFNILCSNN